MRKLLLSFGHAWQGILAALRSERNMKIHAAAALCVVAAGFLFHLERWEWVVVTICIVLVVSMELVNTGIEAMMDHLHPRQHDQVRRIKDISAGAVLVTAAGAFAAGLLVFLPRLIDLILH